MHRRDFLRTSSLAAAVLGAKAANASPGVPSPAIITRTLELTLASPWKAGSSGYPDQTHNFAKRLELALGGRLKLHLQTRPQSAIEAVASGASDLYFGPEHANVAHHPAFAYFAGLPGETSADFATLEMWLTAGAGQELWDELSAKYGVKALMAGHTGPGPGLWSTRPIRALSDIANATVYVEGLAREVVRGLGAQAADLAPDMVASSLARRAIVAAEWGNPAQSLAAGFPSVAKFCTQQSINQQGSVLALTISRPVWDRLTADVQITLSAAAAEECRRACTDFKANDKILRRALSETLQIAFRPLPRDLELAIARVSEAVIADTATFDRISHRINEDYMRSLSPHFGRRERAPAV